MPHPGDRGDRSDRSGLSDRSGRTERVESVHNPRVKSAARLRERGARTESGLTLVDGAREVGRAIAAGVEVTTAFVCDELAKDEEAIAAVAAARRAAAETIDASSAVMERLAFGSRADAVLAVVRTPETALGAVNLPPDPLVVVVDGVEKPGNIGAIVRTADGAGADALIATDTATDLYNPNAIRASLGTIFRLRPASAGVPESIAWLRTNGLRVVAARVDAARRYTDADLTGPLAIVVGSEAAGLGDAWASADMEPVSIPMLGLADSLNVSVAAAILLYEARRQRDATRRR